MTHKQPTFRCGRWFAGFACLLTFLSGASGVLPELCALTASLDRSHTPQTDIQAGGFVLVLSHGKNRAPGNANVIHHHDVVASWLCVLANPNSFGPDHRLEFRSCGTIETFQSRVKLAALTTQSPEVFDSPPRSSPVAARFLFSQAGPKPTGTPESILSTRFTVLLI